MKLNPKREGKPDFSILKPCLLSVPVKAVRITRKNLPQLRELDTGEGVLDMGDDDDDLIGCWYVVDRSGAQVMPEDTCLRRAEQRKDRK